MSRRSSLEPDLSPFWDSVRDILSCIGRQDGRRSREKALARKSMAELLQIEDVTLKSFLNGHQKSLGEGSRNRLFAIDPAFKDLYDALCLVCDPRRNRNSSYTEPARPVMLQLTLAVDEASEETVVLRLRPGSERRLTVALKVG